MTATIAPNANPNINWGQPPKQKSGMGKLVVKLAVGVAVVAGLGLLFTSGAGLGLSGIFGTGATLGSSVALGELGVTDGIAEAITNTYEHIAGIGENTADSTVNAANTALDRAADAFAIGENGEHILSDIASKMPEGLQTSLQSNITEIHDIIANAKNAIANGTFEQLYADKDAFLNALKAPVETAQETITHFASNGEHAELAAESLDTLGKELTSSLKDIANGPGLKDLTAGHYAMAAGGAGAALLGNKLLGGNKQCPPAPHPSQVRADTGKFTRPMHVADINAHLAQHGYAQQPQQAQGFAGRV